VSKFTDRIDMRFKYVPAASTDVRRTIAREIARLKTEAVKPRATVLTLKTKEKA